MTRLLWSSVDPIARAYLEREVSRSFADRTSDLDGLEAIP